MDTAEAKSILLAELEKYRGRSYRELSHLVDAPETLEVTAPSGTWYQLEFEGIWDDKPNDVLRVHGMIDDGGVRAFAPVVECFLINPDGEVIDV
jgi:hypothetical protein